MTIDVDVRKRTPVVTIGMAVLNGGAQLALAVESLLRQSFDDWELLILDDGSTDGAVDQVLGVGDPRIRVLRDGRNEGLARRLNQAIDLARGRYFARMDHDDISHPARLAQQVAYLDAHQEVDLLATSCVTIDESDRITGVLPAKIEHAEICRRLWVGVPMAHPSWMGRISWFKNHLYAYPAPYCAEDQELLIRTAGKSKFHTLPDHLLAYRRRTSPPLKKQFRTRLSLVRVQTRHFWHEAEFFKAFLAIFAALARVGFDLVRILLRLLPQVGKGTNRHVAIPGGVQSLDSNHS